MRFVVFVAASLASLVAGDETLACPAPPVCDYASYEVKVKEVSTERDACLQAKAKETSALTAANAEHTKQLAKAQAEVEQFRKTLGEYKNLNLELEKQVASLQSHASKAKEADEMGRQLATLEKTHKELLDKNAADIAAYKASLDQLRKSSGEQLSSCETARSTISREFQAYKESAGQYETKYAELKGEAERYKDELTIAKRQLTPLVTSVYSRDHVVHATGHVTRIAKAFTAFTHQRFTRLVGPDFVKLVKLQAAVWGRRAQAKSIELGTPLLEKAKEFYAQKLEVHCGTHVARALEFKDKQSVVVVDLAKRFAARFLFLTERSMERIIRNLSTVDPTIGEVFGDNFTDRCFAFAFVMLCFYAATSILQFLFNFFIGGPFCWLFGIGKTKSKKSKKTSTKTGKADTTKGNNANGKDGKIVGKTPAEASKAGKPDAKKTVEKGVAGEAKLNQRKGFKA